MGVFFVGSDMEEKKKESGMREDERISRISDLGSFLVPWIQGAGMYVCYVQVVGVPLHRHRRLRGFSCDAKESPG